MKFKILLLLVLSCFFVGCATYAAKQVHKTNDGESLFITGDWAITGININVNGEAVIKNVNVYDKDNLKGVYKGRKVVAQCKIHTKMFGSEQECDVYVDGEYAANLYFR